ncbi:DOMON-like domain-containing protein [Sphingosinicella sp. CPCC 101087]|uniref:DOMON-like domain-containing protein n=1 Tax=Sphingosinicella sp. CPCC 101087 TaxID=2497754 RepID=UPI00101D77E1|nr:DOMON-like domain-containing protein [Sphingosinicella sp. CPCC 101087]
MLLANLIPHPDGSGDAVTAIRVELLRPAPGRLDLRFIATGAIERVALPPEVSPSERIDGLWQHSCFEAFLCGAPGGPYYEFNFAPSTHWAAYRFDGYRSGMAAPEGCAAPVIRTRSSGSSFELAAALSLVGLPDLPADASWHLGLSAVIEERDGRRAWWALAHPRGAPDFHHEDCFALQLAPVA